MKTRYKICKFHHAFALFGMVLILTFGNSLAQYGAKGDLAKKPNILFIFGDDHSPRTLGVLGNPVIKTPALDSLGNAGMIFHNVYNHGAADAAVCKTSRLMVNTGRYYDPNNTTSPANAPTWGEAMQDLGYATYLSGKWHNSASLNNSFEKNKATSGCACIESNLTGNPYYRPYGEGGTSENPKADGNDWKPTNTIDGHYADQINFSTGKHSSVAISEQAMEYMRQHKTGADKNKPYFMYVAFNAPHDFRQAPQEYQDMYPYENIDFTPNYMETHFPFGEAFTLRDEKLGNYPRDSTIYRQQRSEYYAIITHMDDQIRIMLDSLESLGMLENTYVIYTADHGLAVGEHAMLGKQSVYEHSVKVPYFVAGPGIKPGSHSEALNYFQSIYPTSVELAGGTVPASVNFTSLKENLAETKDKGLENLYFRYRDATRSVRNEFYKVIVYNTTAEKVQLFRLKDASNPVNPNDFADPYEIRDLSEDAEYSQILSGMLLLLEDKMDEIGGTLAYPTPVEDKKLSPENSLVVLPKDTVPISVAANPTEKLDLKVILAGVTEIEVHNTLGEVLDRMNQDEKKLNSLIRWDGLVKGYKVPMGIYHIRYKKGKNVVHTQKVFIQ